MSTNRERLTWGVAGRKASAPPAIPGYDMEDQDHPAHQPDPDASEYENGDTSSWAEDPKQGPYAQGNPPSIPGYDTEDQDHPAHVNLPRVPKEARSLRDQIKVKAAKCLRVARVMLGEYAHDDAIEDQALDLMDLPDEQLTATLNRCGGNPMVADEEYEAPVTDAELDALLAGDLEVEDEVDEGKSAMEELSSRLAEMTKEIEALKAGKRAGQNDPKGKTLDPEAKDEDEARKEAKTAARRFFASMDTDGDGFVVKAEWLGSKAIFAAADKDEDDIVSEDEVVDELTGANKGKKAKKSEVEDDEIDEDEVEEKSSSKKGKKAADDEIEEDDEEETSKKACGPEMTDDADMYGLGTEDPMGLADPSDMSPEEDELLASVFNKAAKKAEENEEGEEDEVEDKKESKKAALKRLLKQAAEELEEEEGEEASDDDDADEKAAKKKAAFKRALKKAEEELEDEEESKEDTEEEEEKAAAKKAARLNPVRTASQRPQPKKASIGPKTLGSQARGNGDDNELSSLWKSAPDVSEVFGMNNR